MEEKIFLQLIRLVVKGRDPKNTDWKPVIYDSNPTKVYEIINRQKLHGFLCEAFISYIEAFQKKHEEREAELASLREAIKREARLHVTTNYYLWYETGRMIRLLKENGIKSVVLKGPTAGILYPEPECRKSGDIDIWIPSADRSGSAKLHSFGKDFERASELLVSLGYTEDKDEESNYHMGFKGSVGLEVELHGKLMREIDSRVTSDVIEIFSKEAADNIREIEVFDGFSVPCFYGAYQGVYLLLHMVHHFVGGGFGYRLLIDWTMYLNSEDDPVQRSILLSYLKKMGLYTFAANLTRISVEKLGLPYEKAAFMYKKKKMESFGAYKKLIKELFDAGEFGHDDGRMVLPRNASVFGLISEFHLQMTRNYPNRSKYVICWPILWVLTLKRYLHNNKVMHRASTVDVIHNAKLRSKLRNDVRLFKE